jgi:hypothetical protein
MKPGRARFSRLQVRRLAPYVPRRDSTLCGLLSSLLLTFALLNSPQDASAGSWPEGGLDVTLDEKWPGCGYGGYFPVRITVVNRNKPRVMTFELRSNYGDMPNVSRTVNVETGRTPLTLLVPCVGSQSYGTVRVRVDGQYINELAESISLPEVADASVRGPAVLYVGPNDPDWSKFKTAAEIIFGAASATASSSSGYMYGSTITAGDEHVQIEASAAPDAWQAYTGVDIVTMPQPQFEQLEPGAREAILQWVNAGGTLLITSADFPGKAPSEVAVEDVQSLNAAIVSAGASAVQANWTPLGDGAGRFFVRPSFFGRLVVVPANPFQDYSPDQWESLLRLAGAPAAWEWNERHGFSARYPSQDFLEFLIPSVKGVPVIAFLVLITLFTIVIGPVNYALLYRKRRLYLLVLTIPLIAVVTSLSLFGYSAVAHGFSTRARVRSLTLLDQRENRAVSASRVSLYSGLAPSSGLKFSRNSAVYPIWAPDGGFESGTVNWTDTQHFASGWLRSRTRTQFFVVTPRDERGRLEVKRTADKLSVANGLEWDLTALVIADDSGRLYYGENLTAGDAANLDPLTEDNAQTAARLFAQNPPYIPAEASAYANQHSSYGYGGYYYGYGAPSASFKSNFAEKQLSALNRPQAFVPGPIQPRSYIALLEENPEVDMGVPSADEESSLHALIGHY